MAFTIYTYSSTAEKNRVDKTNYLTSISSITGTLKEATSIMSPIIKINSATIPTFNYCYIPEFSRYYFVKDTPVLVNGLWEIQLERDVLMSWKTEIGNTTAFVGRNENTYNELIVDNAIGLKSSKTVNYLKSISEGGTVSFNADGYDPYNDYNFVIQMNANLAGSGGTLTNLGRPSLYLVSTLHGITAFMTAVRSTLSLTDIGQYIIRIYSIPGYIPYKENNVAVDFAGNSVVFPGLATQVNLPSSSDGYTLKWYVLNPVNLCRHYWTFRITGRDPDYLASENFRNLTLTFQPFGDVKIDCSQFICGAAEYIDLRLDCLWEADSGNGIIFIETENNSSLSLTSWRWRAGVSNLAVEFPITVQSVNLTGAITGIGGFVAAGMTGGISGVVGGIASIGTIANSIQNSHVGMVGNPSGKFILTPIIIIEDQDVIPVNPSLYGLPLCETKTLNTLWGFTKVEEVHVEIPAFQDEITEIETLLKSGVIL